MTDLNRWIGIGRLTRDVNFSCLQNGTAVAKFSIAVNRSVKHDEQWEDEANFFDVTVFGKTAENLKPYLLKGQQVAIDGLLKQDRWQKDGQNYSKVEIISDQIQLVGGKKSSVDNQNVSSNNGLNAENLPEDIPF
jgi:single-strand DNA-binding protein